MDKIFLSTLILLLTSCNNLTEKRFLTSDNTTGGFMDISLDLNNDNTLRLLKIDQKAISFNEAGTTWVPDTTILVYGTWSSSMNKIHCIIDESPKFVLDAFFNAKFVTKDISINKNRVSFPIAADTIYIYGQPCVETKSTTR